MEGEHNKDIELLDEVLERVRFRKFVMLIF